MAIRFNMALNYQREWSWLLAIWLFMGGSGSGLFIFYGIFGLPVFFALLALCWVLLGGTVLLVELGNPQRMWRAVSKPSTSWLSRGVLFVSFFLVTGFLSIAPETSTFSGLPWTTDSFTGQALAWVAGLCALMITLYPGFFLSANRAIPFWNTPILPVVFFVNALLGGTGLIFLSSGFLNTGLNWVATASTALIAANLVAIAVYLVIMNRASGPAKESVRLLNRGALGQTFQLGVVGAGLILPQILILWFPAAAILAGFLVLAGSLLFRFCVLKAGVFVPSALIAAGLDLGNLNRSSATFKREYAGMMAEDGGRG